MKILILGAKGMLGQELAEVFGREEKNELILWDREELDITQKKDVEEKISEMKPGLVINSAAYTAVDKAESEAEIVYKINGEAVGYLAEACKNNNAKLVHFSTDYVFDGNNSNGYEENFSEKNPETVYGKSKKMAEEKILEIVPEYYIVRTQWLFGAKGQNFIETMLRLSAERNEIKVVNDQFGSPTYAKDLAEKVKDLVENGLESGIYHITNSKTCNWYEFALEIFRLCDIDIKVTSVDSEEFPTAAKRPKYSMLINTKLSDMRFWQESLKVYLKETGRIK